MIVDLLSPYEGLSFLRGEKILVAKLTKAHLVISTCRLNGGLREDITVVANHQACEPKACPGEDHRLCLAVRDPAAYHARVCKYHGFKPETTVLLGTAANMNLAGLAGCEFRDLKVFCAATAGVETNAGRAGDEARVYEWDGSFEHLSCPQAGTINLLIFINQELTPAAMVRSVKMATEAKTSVLQELNVPSRYSSGLATGTGTDQIAIGSLKTGRRPLTGAGKHVKLGELLARAVRKAVFEALGLQNKLTPQTIRYLPRLLERFGLGEEGLLEALTEALPRDQALLLERNFRIVLSDSLLVAHTLAYVHLLDQKAWGIIPHSATEVFLSQATLVAVSLSGKHERYQIYFQRLASWRTDPLKLLVQALALGFAEKWDVPYR
ncbi:adenosylcobinamide amidohydrolase [Thermosulfuriphilus sp.]